MKEKRDCVFRSRPEDKLPPCLFVCLWNDSLIKNRNRGISHGKAGFQGTLRAAIKTFLPMFCHFAMGGEAQFVSGWWRRLLDWRIGFWINCKYKKISLCIEGLIVFLYV